jgi:hypothetical protein
MAYTKTLDPHVRAHAICYAVGTDAILDREHSITVSGVRVDFGKPMDPSLEDPIPRRLGMLEIGRGVYTVLRLSVAEIALFSTAPDSGYPFRLWMPPRQNIVLEITGMTMNVTPPKLVLCMYQSPPHEIPGRYR